MRRGWRAWVAALALVALGAVGGITFDRFHVRNHDPLAHLIAELNRDPVAVMQRELKLRPEQSTRIAAIFARRQGTIDSVWQETHTRLRATVDSVVAEIAAELDPDQAKRFVTMANKVHSSPGFIHHPVP